MKTVRGVYSDRKYIVAGIYLAVMLVFFFRLLFLQIFDESYKISAENNSRRHITLYPARGLITDRKGKMLVFNETSYDITAIPQQVKPFDTVEFCKILDINLNHFKENLGKAARYSKYQPSIVVSQLTSLQCTRLREKFYKFQGFEIQTRTIRNYPEKIAAHLLGYVGEVSDNVIKKDNYYRQGDYMGMTGMERTYEKDLRGVKGKNIYLVDVHNRTQGAYEHGKYDQAAVVGTNLTTTLDAELQKYGELLMQNKKGSIVVIEPATGEILALVSSPSFDPNDLVGAARSKNFPLLLKDELKPLFNRALMAQYPPGSTFKLINALVGLQEGVITTESSFNCEHGYHFGSLTVGCHHSGPINFIHSIASSCNAYYCNVYRKILDKNGARGFVSNYIKWRNYLKAFGLGTKLNGDVGGETRGFVPDTSYFNRYYGRNRWMSITVLSMSIGQGELGITPFQMANMTAAIANRGYYYTPHIAKNIGANGTADNRFFERHTIPIEAKHFEAVINGMEAVCKIGTAAGAGMKDITICGKTGTAQNPHGEDHSIFIAFAPKYNPKIAVSVYVENGGTGATWAAPIASLMIEKYLNGEVKRKDMEKRMIDCDLITPERAKVAKAAKHLDE